MKLNKPIRIGGIIGAILAVPLLFTIFTLEAGTYTGKDGICPYHKVEDQMVGRSKTICENWIEKGYSEGEIRGTGHTCINGVYYNTNYQCITKNLGFIESEAGILIFVWIFLAGFYGIILGGVMGGFIGFMIKKIKRKKNENS